MPRADSARRPARPTRRHRHPRAPSTRPRGRIPPQTPRPAPEARHRPRGVLLPRPDAGRSPPGHHGAGTALGRLPPLLPPAGPRRRGRWTHVRALGHASTVCRPVGVTGSRTGPRRRAPAAVRAPAQVVRARRSSRAGAELLVGQLILSPQTFHVGLVRHATQPGASRDVDRRRRVAGSGPPRPCPGRGPGAEPTDGGHRYAEVTGPSAGLRLAGVAGPPFLPAVLGPHLSHALLLCPSLGWIPDGLSVVMIIGTEQERPDGRLIRAERALFARIPSLGRP